MTVLHSRVTEILNQAHRMAAVYCDIVKTDEDKMYWLGYSRALQHIDEQIHSNFEQDTRPRYDFKTRTVGTRVTDKPLKPFVKEDGLERQLEEVRQFGIQTAEDLAYAETNIEQLLSDVMVLKQRIAELEGQPKEDWKPYPERWRNYWKEAN